MQREAKNTGLRCEVSTEEHITEFGPSPAPPARPLPDRERLGYNPNMARKKREIPPVHPGEILREEFLKPLGLSMNQLALALRVPGNRINAIVAGQRGITADTALRLGRYFGTSAQFWINMQGRCDLESAKDKLADRIEREVHPRERAA
jgi:addiction module HigA family antidote